MPLYAVKENSLICCNYINDTVSDSIEKTFEYFTGQSLASSQDANEMLLKIYGTELQYEKEFQKYEIVELVPISRTCPECNADIRQRESMTEFDIYSPDGEYMGTVYRFNLQDAMYDLKLITEGHCPICEEWSAGTEDFCSRNGWGKTKNLFRDMKRIDKLPLEPKPPIRPEILPFMPWRFD